MAKTLICQQMMRTATEWVSSLKDLFMWKQVPMANITNRVTGGHESAMTRGGSVVRSGGGWVVGGISSSRSVFTWGFCCHKYFPARAPCSLYIYKLDQIM